MEAAASDGATAFIIFGEAFMRYVNDKPIDFTNEDWRSHTPRERARIEALERKEEEKRRRKKQKSLPRILFGWFFLIVIASLFGFVSVYTFGQQRINIGQAMDPTLAGGDVCLVNILAYQVGTPKTGDIVSYRPNGSSNARPDIKRVIAVPGQKIQIKDGLIYINDQVYLEEKDYPAITRAGLAENPIRLQEGEYFVLGDNRNNSEDSRNPEIGLVTSDMMEGKVWFVLSPAEHRGFM